MKKELIVHKDPKSPISEVFRTLRANIQFMNSKKRTRVILVTSTVPGEGKSWISSNLAVAFAQAGRTVLLIDSDMRKGRQYTIFGVSPKPGLSNYLSGIGVEGNKDSIENYIQETGIENLYVMPAGDIPPNPSELLISSRMENLLKQLKEECDIVIVDGTPCELVTDSLVLIRNVDTTIVVTAYKKTKKDGLRKVVESIKNVGGKNIGIVLNKIPISARKYEENYYYGSLDSKNDMKYLESNTTTLSREKEEKIAKQIRGINDTPKTNKDGKKSTTKRKTSTSNRTTKTNTKKKNTTANKNTKTGTKKKTSTTNKNSKTKANKKNEKSINDKMKISNKEISIERKNDILNQINEFIEKQEEDEK